MIFVLGQVPVPGAGGRRGDVLHRVWRDGTLGRRWRQDHWEVPNRLFLLPRFVPRVAGFWREPVQIKCRMIILAIANRLCKSFIAQNHLNLMISRMRVVGGTTAWWAETQNLKDCAGLGQLTSWGGTPCFRN